MDIKPQQVQQLAETARNLGVPQREIVEKAGVSRETVRLTTSGTRLNRQVIEAMAELVREYRKRGERTTTELAALVNEALS